MPLGNICRIDPLPWPPTHEYAVVTSTRLNRNSLLKITRLQSVIRQLVKNRKKCNRHCLYDVGWRVCVLMDLGSLYQLQPVVSIWFPFILPDARKVVSGVKSMLATLWVRTWELLWLRYFSWICVPDTFWPSATVYSSFRDPLLPKSSNYHITPAEICSINLLFRHLLHIPSYWPITVCTVAG